MIKQWCRHSTLRLTRQRGLGGRFAGPTETGWRIVSLWDSREAFDAYVRDRLAPALERAGIPIPEFEFWPIESVIIT